MNYSSRALIKILEGAGFYFKRSKGSHHIYFNPKTGITVVVPIHNRDLKKGTFMGILKRAGFNEYPHD